jgi:hypothetical protein
MKQPRYWRGARLALGAGAALVLVVGSAGAAPPATIEPG